MKPQEPDDSSSDQIGQLLRFVGPREAVPVQREARVKDAVREVWLEEIGYRKRRRALYGAVGIGLAALLALVVGLRQRDPLPPTVPMPEVLVATVERVISGSGVPGTSFVVGQSLYSGTEIITTPDSQLALHFETGPSVRIDEGSRLHLESSTAFSLQAGTVYVDSGLANDATLEIHTPLGIARDIGTQFEVRVTEGDVWVRVREGKVLLDRDGSIETAEAGDQLTASADGVVRSTVAIHGDLWGWILQAAPIWDLEGRTLEEILEWISRETGLEVRFRDVADAKLASRFHGSLPTIRANQAAAVVLPTFGLKATEKDGVLWVEAF